MSGSTSETVEKVSGGDQIRNLAVGNFGLTKCASALTESGEVERERRVAALGETGGVELGHLLFHRQP